MRGEPWTDMELQELYEVVNYLDWFETVRPFILNRSDEAIRRRMSQLRIEAGIVPQRSGPRSFSRAMSERDKARYASARLLKAMLELA